jgi:Na+-translocating ferredoxin:NAD+ oxidoreductase RnfC subunit
MKQARMTQAQFDAEVDNQIQVEVDVEYALVIVRRKRKEYTSLVAAEERRRQLEEDLARMRDQIAHQQATQQAKEKAEEEQNWQRSLSAKIDAHQKVITREALGSQCVSRSVQESMSHNSLIEDSSFSNRTFIA